MSMRWLARALALAAGVHVVTSAQAPPPDRSVAAGIRTGHAVGFYDARLRRVVVIGGAGDPTDGQRDTAWSWNGHSWDVETDTGPPGRVNAGAAYDARLGRAIVAAGSRKIADGTWAVVGDTWLGDRGGWRRIADLAPRDHQSLVADGRGRVLLFGGIPADRSAPWPTDTWALDGEAWVRVATGGPAARGRTAMAYDGRRQQVVLFGGVAAPPEPNQPQAFFDDTWTWDGARWRLVAAKGPRGRYAHGMVFDERTGDVLLYGGAAAHRDAPLSDMWRWNGSAWTEIPLTGPTPGHRYQPVMVYDAARGRTILHGGIGGVSDTWEWDGAHWRQIAS